MPRHSSAEDPFTAIADPRRRDILALLAHAERSVTDVVDALRAPQPQVSKHLRVLRDAGLVRVRHEGRRRLYSIRPDRLHTVRDWIDAFERLWDHQLAATKRIAEAAATQGRTQMTAPTADAQRLFIERSIDIDAPPRIAWAALLQQMGPQSQLQDATPMPMTLEPYPGGRWFRDLGDNAGHLWGHVQVIKPPTLLEIHGPLFMSYAAISHVRYRLTENAQDGTTLSLTHHAIGDIHPEHREGVSEGWQYVLNRIRNLAQG